MDKLNDDCLYVLLSYLPFEDKVRLQRVNKQWRNILGRLLVLQKSLGNTRSRTACRCSDACHWISDNDIVPKRWLTNLSVLPLILRKCPELKSLSITDLNEMNFEETELREMKKKLRMRLIMMHRRDKVPPSPPSPRPYNEENFLTIVAKYAPKLECIDISGLRIHQNYAAQKGGMWRGFGLQCGQNLRHLKVYSISDHELGFLLEVAPHLSEIAACMGPRGTHLAQVPPNFERLSIYCLRLPGLQELARAGPNSVNLKSLSLNNVTRDVVHMICAHFVNLEKLSLRLQVSTISPTDIEEIRKLSRIKRLSLKRRETSRTVTPFDGSFLVILNYCIHLETIVLSNLYVTDHSVKAVSSCCPLLKEFRICYANSLNQDVLISNVAISALTRAENLKYLKIDYPNFVNEDGIIYFLLNAKSIQVVVMKQCKELIPALELIQASVNAAKKRPHSSLSLTLTTPEKIPMNISRYLSNIIPANLYISLVTGMDSWSSKLDTSSDETDGDSEDDVGKVSFDWEDDRGLEGPE